MPETEDDPLGVDPARRRVHSSMYAGLRTNLPRVRISLRTNKFSDCRLSVSTAM